jgi:hypothetical protein
MSDQKTGTQPRESPTWRYHLDLFIVFFLIIGSSVGAFIALSNSGTLREIFWDVSAALIGLCVLAFPLLIYIAGMGYLAYRYVFKKTGREYLGVTLGLMFFFSLFVVFPPVFLLRSDIKAFIGPCGGMFAPRTVSAEEIGRLKIGMDKPTVDDILRHRTPKIDNGGGEQYPAKDGGKYILFYLYYNPKTREDKLSEIRWDGKPGESRIILYPKNLQIHLE